MSEEGGEPVAAKEDVGGVADSFIRTAKGGNYADRLPPDAKRL
jgi:hypothetical protein